MMGEMTLCIVMHFMCEQHQSTVVITTSCNLKFPNMSTQWCTVHTEKEKTLRTTDVTITIVNIAIYMGR